MHSNPISKIVILGGGSAGWMTAAALSHFLGKKMQILLIESDEIGIVGVGEATIPHIKHFNSLLNIKTEEFMKHCQGTFKLGIQFEHWGALGDSYLHTFDHIGYENAPTGFHHYWLRARAAGNKSDYWDYSLNKKLTETSKFDANIATPYNSVEYAYHFDARLYAGYLRKMSEARGVQRREGIVSQVKTCPDTGIIKTLIMHSGEAIDADFFIDCTGFRSLLIEQTLHTGYEDWSHWLPCDRAVALQSTSVGEPRPYTRSIAHAAGWQWQIPLQHRTGNGLVYCSRYLDDAAAEQLLRDNIQGEVITKPNLIRFRTGRRLKSWNKNCVAIGLSGGFLEPLESTSLHLIQTGITRLLKLFPRHGMDTTLIEQYNSETKTEYEQIRDFIVLHYVATTRSDSPFWNHCRTMDIPESLKHKMSLFRNTGNVIRENNELFSPGSWIQVQMGQGITPTDYHPVADMIDENQLDSVMTDVKEAIAAAVEKTCTHQEFINQHCKHE